VEVIVGKKILIPLNRHDEIHGMLPYIEEIAKPGMTIVFLIHCPEDGSVWLKDQITLMQTGIKSFGTLRAAIAQRLKRKTIEANIRAASKSLRQMNIEIIVSFCEKQSMARAVSEHTANGQDCLVLMPAPAPKLLGKLLERLRSRRGTSLQVLPRRFLLFHP
jgi:hypothetical protein